MPKDPPLEFTRRGVLAACGAAAVSARGNSGARAANRSSHGGFTTRLDDIARWIADELTAGRVTGAAVSLAHEGTIIWEQGFGFANLQAKVPATPHTPFGLASVTKPFTTAAVMALVQDGKMDLDQSIQRYLSFTLPKSDFDTDAMTPRLLGGHAGGLPSLFQLADEAGHPPPFETVSRNFGRMAYPAAERYEYSNIGYGLLGAALSHLDDRPFEEVVHRRIIEPMGLNNSFFVTNEARVNEAAIRYNDDAKPYPYYTTVTPPSGELCSSVHDLSIFAANIMGVRNGLQVVLSKAALADMHRAVFRAGKSSFSAFGMEGFHAGDELVLMKGGGDPGVATQLTLLPARRISIAVVANRSNYDFVNQVNDRLASIFVSSWIGQPEDLAAPTAPTAASPGKDVARQPDAAWFHGTWRGTLSNNGITLPVQLVIGADGSACQIGDNGWMPIKNMKAVYGSLIGRCTGTIHGEHEGAKPGDLSFKLVNRSSRLVGRFLTKADFFTLPYIVNLERI